MAATATPTIHGVPLSTPNSKLLRVKVVQAKDLNKDLFGSSDPFVQIGLYQKNNEMNVIELVKTPTLKRVSRRCYLGLKLEAFFKGPIFI